MKWFDYLMFGMLFVIIYFVAAYQKCEVEELYEMIDNLQKEITYQDIAIERLERLNDTNLQLLAEGWEGCSQ